MKPIHRAVCIHRYHVRSAKLHDSRNSFLLTMVLHLTLRNAPFRSSLLGCHVSIHPASPPVNLHKYTRIHFNIACREANCQCATAKFKNRLHEILPFGILACYACTFVFPGTASNFKAGMVWTHQIGRFLQNQKDVFKKHSVFDLTSRH